MRSLLPFISESSTKYLRSLLKNIPNKIYSVEIKIRSEHKEPLPLEDSSSVHLTSSHKSSDGTTTDKGTLPPPSGTTKATSELNSKSPSPGGPSPPSSKNPNNTSSSHPFEDNLLFESQFQVIDRTRRLVKSLTYHSNLLSQPTLPTLLTLNASLKELNKHIEKHPEASNLVIRENVIPKLLQIRELAKGNVTKKGAKSAIPQVSVTSTNESPYKHLKENSRRALSLLGYTDPPKGRGIKILSIDGGGK